MTDEEVDAWVERERQAWRGNGTKGTPEEFPEARLRQCLRGEGPWAPTPPQPDPPVADPPGFFQKATHFAAALVEHLASGAETASEDLVRERLAICRGCEQFQADDATCRLCGCNMAVKVTWLEQQCPLSKWPAPAGERR